MKKSTPFLTALFLLVFLFDAAAQERDRFNIGIHYNPPIDNTVANFSGGLDLRVRAVSLGMFNLGAGLSASYRTQKPTNIKDYVVWNPHVYVEVQPFSFALKPYVNIGYAFYKQEYTLTRIDYYPDAYDPAFSNDNSTKTNGVTLMAGVRFDFAKFLFADAGLKYYSLKVDDPNYAFTNKSYGMLHVGFGFRF